MSEMKPLTDLAKILVVGASALVVAMLIDKVDEKEETKPKKKRTTTKKPDPDKEDE